MDPPRRVNLDEVRTAIIKPPAADRTWRIFRRSRVCTARSEVDADDFLAHHREALPAGQCDYQDHPWPRLLSHTCRWWEGAPHRHCDRAAASWQWHAVSPQQRTAVQRASMTHRDLQSATTAVFRWVIRLQSRLPAHASDAAQFAELKTLRPAHAAPGATTSRLMGWKSGHVADWDQIEFNVKKQMEELQQRLPSIVWVRWSPDIAPGYDHNHQRPFGRGAGGLARHGRFALLRDPKEHLGLPNAEDGARA